LAAIFDNALPVSFPETAGSAVGAFGVVQAAPDVLAGLRRNPAPGQVCCPPANLLKYADDQAVAAVAAVFTAIHDYQLQDRSFTDWSVVAAPRYLGRTTTTAALNRFRRQGAPGVSPLIIPYLSQHGISGTISLALRVHGPNVGAGGGLGSVGEALLTALTVQAEHRPPGVWVVVTEWDPEPIADEKGRNRLDSVCHAVALALVPDGIGPCGLRLRLLPAAPGSARDEAPPPDAPPSLAGLACFLKGLSEVNCRRSWCYPFDWGGRLELSREPVSQAAPEPARPGSRPGVAA
jgi:hypothetical protein